MKEKILEWKIHMTNTKWASECVCVYVFPVETKTRAASVDWKQVCVCESLSVYFTHVWCSIHATIELFFFVGVVVIERRLRV